MTAIKVEVVNRQIEQAQNGGILHIPGRGQQLRTRIYNLNEQLDCAWRDLLEHEHPNAWRWVLYGGVKIGPAEYRFLRDVSYAVTIATRGDILTGGGPGAMEAGFEGNLLAEQAYNGRLGSRRIAINIDLGFKETPNGLATHSSRHREFFPRLSEFEKFSNAAFIGPGGFGTNAEMSLCLQLIQEGINHAEGYTVIAHPFWQRYKELLQTMMFTERTGRDYPRLIGENDLDKLIISDDIDVIVSHMTKNYKHWYETIGKHVNRVETPSLWDQLDSNL